MSVCSQRGTLIQSRLPGFTARQSSPWAHSAPKFKFCCRRHHSFQAGCVSSSSQAFYYSPTSNSCFSFQGLADTRIPRSGTPLSIRSSRSVSILRIPSQSQISQTYTQGSLHRSISQLMDIPDKKGLADDSLWETIMGHSSGLVS